MARALLPLVIPFLTVLSASAPALAQTSTVAPAQTVQSNADGTLAIHVSDMPLGQLMRSIAEVSPFAKLTLDPESESQRVTLSLERVSLREALATILRAADVDYALVGTTRLVVRGADGRLAEIRVPPRPGSVTKDREDGVQIATSEKASDPSLASEKASDSFGIEPADSAVLDEAARQAEVGVQALQYVLSGPAPGAPPAGSLVELPFPGPDGAWLTTIMPPKGTPIVLPFPGASTVSPATPIPPAPARSTDPELQRLYDALSPQPGRIR